MSDIDHMNVDPQDLADRLGIEYRGRTSELISGEEAAEAQQISVRFFKLGDPKYTWVTSDGGTIARGVPVEEFRRRLTKDDGFFRGPYGKLHPISIPADVRDGEGTYVSVSITSRQPK